MKKPVSCLMLSILILSSISCNRTAKSPFSIDSIQTYREIPGVTEDEISAIESIRGRFDHFVYGALPGTESFHAENGDIRGYSAFLCEWLTGLFGIPFKPELAEHDDLKAGLANFEIDFTGALTNTEARRKTYFMTTDMGTQTVRYFRLANSTPLEYIAESHPLRYAFLDGAATIDEVVSRLEPGSYEIILVKNADEAYSKLVSGEADAFFDSSIAEASFDVYGNVISRDFFPLIISHVSLATQNPALEPVISVVQKALNAGVGGYLTTLHSNGYREYQRHKISLLLTDEEKQYIKNHAEVKFVAEYYNYPISFYNTYEHKWQGITFDLLDRVEGLTGLSFKLKNDQYTEWPDLLRMVEEGEVPMSTELVRSKGREGRFLWPERASLIDKYALMSKSDFPNLSINEIMSVKVGLVWGSVYAEIFNRWFPNHPNTVEFISSNVAFAALQRGEVDVVMSSEHRLLAISHFNELVDYKTNIVFDFPADSHFGFNKNEAVLCSIVDKAFSLIDMRSIAVHWEQKTYDYNVKLYKARIPWLISGAALLLIIILLLFILFYKKHHERIRLEALVHERTAEAEAASKSKSEFLAKMSHDIRTPMNSIMGFAELALDNDVSPRVREYLVKITDSIKWLLHIINDVLDISKIESGKMELQSIPFDLQGVFARCQSVILPDVNKKGLDLRVYAEPRIGKKLMGDPVRLFQALMNLLSNAVKFTDSGTVRFTSAINNVDDNTTTVYFEVRDSGIGMTPLQVEKIFEPFVQAGSDIARNYNGTGLGLVITKNIVERMGGKLAVESSPGGGSTFSFELTFETVDAPGITPGQPQDDILEKPHFDGLVLVCEDNYMNQQLICDHLTRVGLQPALAGNGKIGVEMVQERIRKGQKPYDLIFLDIFMPVMDGIEAASRIIELGTGTPIVAMTANIMTSEVEKYKKSGISDCVGKPFTSQDLWRCLLKHLTPMSVSVVNAADQTHDNDSLRKNLKLNFVKYNKTKFSEIVAAINASDINLAHRLSHSLKGNAGLIGKTKLENCAAEFENMLRDGIIPTAVQISSLETEFNDVLEELKTLPDGSSAALTDHESLNADQTLTLFEQLESMLENKNPECANLLDEIRAIPGSEELTRQIEKCDFAAAARTLAELKKKNSVLIVDDEELNIMALTQILSPNYTVYTAKNGQDAITAAKKYSPDVILLDILMPEMNGYTVIYALKSHEKTQAIPVIFVSGLRNAGDEEKGLALGAADYISKPFSAAIVKLRVYNQVKMLNQFHTIERLSMRDQLTEIFNRRGFDNRINMEWIRAIRKNATISILMIDVDKFKEYNDTYGHQQGDVVLQTVAQTVTQALNRPGDIAARWGGEEFVVLLPNTELTGALNIAERLRLNVEKIMIPCTNGVGTKITISIGVNTQTPAKNSSLESFISKADKALYEAKAAGRNKVCRTKD